MHVLAQVAEPGVAVDTASMTYERLRWQQDPTLALSREFAVAGTQVGYTLTGMGATAAFELRFDGTLLETGVTSAGGAASGSFTVPAAAEGFRFVSAVDDALHVASSGVVVREGVLADGFED